MVKTAKNTSEKLETLEEVTDPVTGKPTLQLASLFKN
jgi:hypothetical protein